MEATELVEERVDVRTVATADVEAQRRAAFERFSQSRLDRAYRLASVILRDGADAEDAVHDAAVQAWLHWADLREPERVDAWFDRILVNECRARLRRRTARLLTTDLREPVAPDPFRATLDGDVLNRALAALDPDRRIAVVLRYIGDLSPAEIATRTGAREGTVKSRLHYALRRMRSLLESGDRDAAGGPR